MDYKKLLKALLCDGSGVGEDINGCTNKKCKYRDGDEGCNLTRMCGDADIAINELLTENQALRNAANGFKKQAEAAESRAEKAERERDYAIKQLKIAADENGECWGCKWFDDMTEKCTNPEGVVSCSTVTNNMWEWRGLKEE